MSSNAQAEARPAPGEEARHATEQELAWERKWGLPVGVASLGSAALLLASLFLRASALKGSSNDADEVLRTANRHASGVYASAVTQALGTLLIAAALVYLYRATAHRRPRIPRPALGLAVLGAVAAAALSFVAQHELVRAADEFVNSKPATFDPSQITKPQAYLDAVENLDPTKRAEDISNAHFGAGLQVALIGSNFVLGLGFLLTSLWARRAGLLSRFMGILGIIVGVLYCLPFLGGGGGFIQIPWLAAVGLIFIDRWPTGRGDAWTTGEPVPWLSAAELRAMEARGQKPPGKEEPQEEDASNGNAQGPARSSRKRKRKKGRKH